MRLRPVRLLLAVLLSVAAGMLAAALYSTFLQGSSFRDALKDSSFGVGVRTYHNRQVNLTNALKRKIEPVIPSRGEGNQADHWKDVNMLNSRRYNQKFGGPEKLTEELFLSDVASDIYAKKFPFRVDFTLPQPKAVLSYDEINRSVWLHDLRVFLSNFTSKTQLSLVTSNIAYTDVLLNWLISYSVRCKLPLGNVLVLSLDSSLHYMLVRRAINSVYLPLQALVSPQGNFSQPFDLVMMTRLAVMRIVNHFGFDVVNYDTDAVLLADPQPLYDELKNDDIIGSVGKIPFDLAADWGITICIGVVLVRSNLKTEAYWNSMPGICPESYDDQEKLNCGLKALDIHWKNNDSSYQNTTVFGITRSSEVRVSILPYKYICRQLTCIAELRNSFHIWHKGGSRKKRDKLRGARDGQTWFLRYKWNTIRNSFLGQQWLDSIAYYTVTRS